MFVVGLSPPHAALTIIVSEKEIGDVKPGQQVILGARAHPEVSLTGTVEAISPRRCSDRR